MTSTERCQRLMSWFRDNGGYLHPDTEIVENEQFGLHLRARRRLMTPEKGSGRPGEHVDGAASAPESIEICCCPVHLTISYLNASDNRKELAVELKIPVFSVTSAHLVGHVSESTIGYFVLVEQRLLGEKSFWYPYISCLPAESELTTPMYFSQDDLQWLLGTNLHTSNTDSSRSSVELRRNMWNNEWQQSCEVLRSQGVDTSKYTWELFLWAATIFTSRCFPSDLALPNQAERAFFLYPALDSLNHEFGAKVFWFFKGGAFSLSVQKTAEEGEQVFNNYAPKGNEEFLLGYGFTLANNPSDEVMVRLGKPPPPVHAVLKSTLPEHFKSEEWNSSEATFYLRSPNHFSGGYDHGIMCLRGIPFEIFRMLAETVYFMSTGETDGAGDLPEESEQFGYVVEEFLHPLRQRLELIVANKVQGEPVNQKQAYAKVYRDGQIEILECIISELEERLKSAPVQTEGEKVDQL